METPRSAVVPDYYSLLDAEIRDAIRDGDLDPYTSQDAVEGLRNFLYLKINKISKIRHTANLNVQRFSLALYKIGRAHV